MWLASAQVEAEAGQDTGSYMPPKIGNALPLFINVIKCAGSLFNSGVLDNFIQVKVREVCLIEWASLPYSKMLMWKWKFAVV